MNTQYDIEVNYANMKKVCSEIDEAAAKLDQQKESYSTCRSNIAKVWKGENANSYLVKMQCIEEQMSSVSKTLKNISQTLNTYAENVRSAELNAIELANARIYNK